MQLALATQLPGAAHAGVPQRVGGQLAAGALLLARGFRAQLGAPLLHLPHQGGVPRHTRAVVQLLARGFVAGVQPGGIVVPLQARGDVPGKARFQPLDAGGIHVVVLVNAARADFLQQAVGNELLDFGMEHRGPQRQLLRGLPVGTQLKGVGGFRLDVAVAQEGVRPLGPDVVGRNLLERGRFEGVAITALDDQVRAGLPHQVGTRADFRAKNLVVVATQAQGGHQVLAQGELILHEQGFVRGFVLAVFQPGIDQLFLAPFAAHGDLVAAPARAGVAVHHAVAHVLRTRGGHAVVAEVADADVAAVGPQLAAPAIAPIGIPAGVLLRAI